MNKTAYSANVQVQTLVQTLSASDKLWYKLQGQLLSEDQIASFREYIEKYLEIRNVSGVFTPSPGLTTIKKYGLSLQVV